jgi:hypothetical protein
MLYMFIMVLLGPWQLGHVSGPTLVGFIGVLLCAAIMLVWRRIIAPRKPIGASFS